jgi:superfamily I DNA/RNA helicase
LRREPKGNRFGRVFIGSIEEARGLVFQLVCVPGLCEGTFPKPHFDDPLLPRNLAELEAGERRLVRQACAAATKQIILSWPRVELSSGRVRVPSFYVLEAARVPEMGGASALRAKPDPSAGSHSVDVAR